MNRGLVIALKRNTAEREREDESGRERERGEREREVQQKALKGAKCM